MSDTAFHVGNSIPGKNAMEDVLRFSALLNTQFGNVLESSQSELSLY
jgi:hypothetical protein